MRIHEVNTPVRLKHISLSGGDKMRAHAREHEDTVWLAIGEAGKETSFDDVVAIFFGGPDAAEKTRRLAEAINAIMAEAAAAPAELNQAAE